MLDFLNKFFRREESSKSFAKERLRLVLMSDRVSLAPETFDAMKVEMLSVLQRYLDIDERGLDVHFENAEKRFMLLANIPVLNVKSSEDIERQRVAVGGGNGLRTHSGTNGSGPRRRRRRRRTARSETATNGHTQPECAETQSESAAEAQPEDGAQGANP